jgi:hypothetical protein
LLLGTCTNTSGTTGTSNNLNGNTNQTPGTVVQPVFYGAGGASTTNPSGLNGGLTGDILFLGNGATIFGTGLDMGNNTGVAGFFGNNTFGGGQPQSVAIQMCKARPWAAGFLSNILPVAFFDGLCTAHGYQVGNPPPPAPIARAVNIQQTAPPATTTPAAASRVQIWAVPASVPLDTRVSIFWNTQGVTDCTETSPDGSFNQTSLSGGAASQPLSGATTFTISCLDTGGNTVTDYVTVNLSI